MWEGLGFEGEAMIVPQEISDCLRGLAKYIKRGWLANESTGICGVYQALTLSLDLGISVQRSFTPERLFEIN